MKNSCWQQIWERIRNMYMLFILVRMIPLTDALDSIVSLKPGTGPRHIVFHPTNPIIYPWRTIGHR